jgi:hypothetical protein
LLFNLHTRDKKSTRTPDVCAVQVLADDVIPSIIGADGLEFTQVRLPGIVVPLQHEQQHAAVAVAVAEAWCQQISTSSYASTTSTDIPATCIYLR